MVRTVPVKTPSSKASSCSTACATYLCGSVHRPSMGCARTWPSSASLPRKVITGLKMLLAIIADSSDARLPENARASLSALVVQIASCQAEIGAIEKRLLSRASQKRGQQTARDHSWHRRPRRECHCRHGSRCFDLQDRARLSRPGSASSRAKDSTGGKQRLGPISKQGDRYLRRILVCRGVCRDQAGARPSREVPLADATIGAQAGKGCCGGIG